jgi:hypothetical protein
MLSENKEKVNEKSNGTSLHLSAGGYVVVLNFFPRRQNSIITEVKRMILSGHISTKVQ